MVSDTSNGVVLTWSSAAGATSYTVLREDPGSSTFNPITTGLASPTYTDVNIMTGQTYQYEVQAVNTLNSSDVTGSLATVPIPTPTNLIVANATATGVTLTWTASAGAASYSVAQGGFRLIHFHANHDRYLIANLHRYGRRRRTNLPV